MRGVLKVVITAPRNTVTMAIHWYSRRPPKYRRLRLSPISLFHKSSNAGEDQDQLPPTSLPSCPGNTASLRLERPRRSKAVSTTAWDESECLVATLSGILGNEDAGSRIPKCRSRAARGSIPEPSSAIGQSLESTEQRQPTRPAPARCWRQKTTRRPPHQPRYRSPLHRIPMAATELVSLQ